MDIIYNLNFEGYTIIIQIDPKRKNTAAVKNAVEILNNGGVIVYPTETAYGLGCDVFNVQAVKKIFTIKNRPKDHPLSIIVDSFDMINTIAEVSPSAKKLIQRFHPGPLVIALPKKTIIPDEVNSNCIALRISSNQFANSIVQLLGKPLISTSANKTGKPTPYNIQDIVKSFNESEIDAIFDSGVISNRKPSTIIDFTIQPVPQITREGEISSSKILSILNIPQNSWKKHLKEK